ncbi:Uncharacterised protein [Burkholderia pseudomallei]|nr:Uncharacterised protein [Burkholderia pseudomallei]CAJ4612478.1 Uncharacterised protein [Burkholderia pseudomallei]
MIALSQLNFAGNCGNALISRRPSVEVCVLRNSLPTILIKEEMMRISSLIARSAVSIITILFLYAEPVYAQTNDECNLPISEIGISKEELMWRFFVAANCKTKNPDIPLAWQAWPEQSCLLAGGKDCTNISGTQRLHPSILAAKGATSPGPCQPMTTLYTMTNLDKREYGKFVPKNLTDQPVFCEEVHVNRAEADYIISPQSGFNLQTLEGQKSYIKNSKQKTINFPRAALEIKADWMPASSLRPSKTFNCDKPPSNLFVQKIGAECYALVAMHFSSKLKERWIWATFEAQSDVTNPNGCDPDLYTECVDNWGSLNKTTRKGQPTIPTSNLLTLMNKAGIDAAFKNYRLVGVQDNYYSPQYLSNSFVEFNAQVPRKDASCMTCHFNAAFTKNTEPITGNLNFGPFPGAPGTGIPLNSKVPSLDGWYLQDFSWLLGIMPAKGTTAAAQAGRK